MFTRTARIIAVEPNAAHPEYVTVRIHCPICGHEHEHGAPARGLTKMPTGRRRAAPCGSDVTAADRSGGYYLADPDRLIGR